jgi:hypothetical protein
MKHKTKLFYVAVFDRKKDKLQYLIKGPFLSLTAALDADTTGALFHEGLEYYTDIVEQEITVVSRI